MKYKSLMAIFAIMIIACKSNSEKKTNFSGIDTTVSTGSLEGIIETPEEKAARVKESMVTMFTESQNRFAEAGTAAEATTKDAILNYVELLKNYESAAATLAGDSDSISKVAKVELKKLRAQRAKDFNKLRANYGKWANAEAWENDMKVKVSGTTIRFIHHSFAANKNIKTAFETLESVLRDLEFKQVRFEWYEGSEYTYYTLD